MRFKPILKPALGMELDKDADWQFICDCEKVRDCLLHANGRIDLLREKKKVDLEGAIKRFKDLLTVRTDNVEIAGEFLEKFHTVANNFIAKVEAKAKP